MPTPDQVSEDAVVALATELIRIRSDNPPADYAEISEFLRKKLEDTGAEVTVVEGQVGKPNVLGLLRGTDADGPVLLLDAHMDVVPAGDPTVWSVDPYAGEVRDGIIWGRGAMDTKSNLAAMFETFRLFALEPTRPRGSLMIAFTNDDETGGVMGMSYVFTKGLANINWPRPTFQLVPEPNQINVTVAFKGRMWVEVEAIGRSSHGARPHQGINAIDMVNEVGARIRGLMSGQWEIVGPDTFNYGIVSGGSQVNIVPDQAKATFDLRFGRPQTTDKLESAIRDVCADVEKEFEGGKISFRIFERREPVDVDPETPSVVLLRDVIKEVTGREPEIQGTLSAGDLYEPIKAGIPGVLVSAGDPKYFHAVDEQMPIAELVAAERVYVKFASKYLEG
jgi:acetylornithine deacetylase/succinyl-diaminopimelate desuccinylase family protein